MCWRSPGEGLLLPKLLLLLKLVLLGQRLLLLPLLLLRLLKPRPPSNIP